MGIFTEQLYGIVLTTNFYRFLQEMNLHYKSKIQVVNKKGEILYEEITVEEYLKGLAE